MKKSDANKLSELDRRKFMSFAAKSYLGVNLFPMLGAGVGNATEISGAKAKRVIYLYMGGGMSHVDTFDPKPKKKDVMGETEAIATSADGIQVGHYLPKTAKIMDKVCVVNSMTSNQGAHEQGSYVMRTSYAPRGTVTHPTLGAWTLKLAGRLNAEIPGYVAINGGGGGGGFFGAKYGAAPIGNANSGLRDSSKPRAVGNEDFERRLSLADRLNKQFHERYENSEVKGYEDLYSEAVRLMNSEDLKAFNISGESSAARKHYGNGRFAQGCLLARRLVEHDVRFVEVHLGGWDTHYDNFAGVEARCAEFDAGYSALISDLAERDMLKDTLVVVATEFGRSPEIKTNHNNGRDHHPAAFSCLLAGGGVKGGYKYGETDASAARIKANPVPVQDFNATIAHSLGLPHDLVIMSPTKRPFRMADKGSPIKDVFA
ncbi:DUF1501 domain-containing protein [Haloferula sp.]|uniref:DUF1501 domain-containing protein n=1 Tax=Haloferula sp. TaxID=2497595 RepID=UPI00329D977B